MATRTIANGGGNWSATGTWVEGAVPTASDDVVATSTSGQLTLDVTGNCQSIDLTNYTNTFTMSGQLLNVGSATGGKVKFVAGMTLTVNSSSSLKFISTSNNSGSNWPVTTGGKSMPPVNFSGVGGGWTLQDSWTSANSMTLANGTLDTGNQSITSVSFNMNNSNTRTLTLGSTTWSLSGGGTFWGAATTTGLTFNVGTSTIINTDNSASAKTFAGGGLTYHIVSHTSTGTGTFTISGANTFDVLNMTGATRTVIFPASTTTTINTTFNVNGTSGHLITINSSASGTQATLSKSSGTISCDFLSIKDSAATGGASWYAGANSTSVSNNSGWIFTAPPAQVSNLTVLGMG